MTTCFSQKSYLIDLLGRFIRMDMRRGLLSISHLLYDWSNIAFDHKLLEEVTVDGLSSGCTKTVAAE